MLGEKSFLPLTLANSYTTVLFEIVCGGCRVWSKAMDLGSIPIGVRRFESGPPHLLIYSSTLSHLIIFSILFKFQRWPFPKIAKVSNGSAGLRPFCYRHTDPVRSILSCYILERVWLHHFGTKGVPLLPSVMISEIRGVPIISYKMAALLGQERFWDASNIYLTVREMARWPAHISRSYGHSTTHIIIILMIWFS